MLALEDDTVGVESVVEVVHIVVLDMVGKMKRDKNDGKNFDLRNEMSIGMDIENEMGNLKRIHNRIDECSDENLDGDFGNC